MMKRGFVYSLAALTLVLAVAQAAILISAQNTPPDFEKAYYERSVLGNALLMEANAGFDPVFSESCILATAAARDYETLMAAPLVNSSCVIAHLALAGNVTTADCPGETFERLDTLDYEFSLKYWADNAAQRKYGAVILSESVEYLNVEDGLAGTECSAKVQISASTASQNTNITRQYSLKKTG